MNEDLLRERIGDLLTVVEAAVLWRQHADPIFDQALRSAIDDLLARNERPVD